jgi:type I restriction enzyme M protein
VSPMPAKKKLPNKLPKPPKTAHSRHTPMPEESSPSLPAGNNNHVQIVWNIAELLRGNFRAHQYGAIILPFLVLRRLECVLEPTREKVLDEVKSLPKGADEAIKEKLLNRAAGHKFHNATKWTLEKIKGDTDHLLENLNAYVSGFSSNVRDVLIDKFKLLGHLEDLDKADLLFNITEKFSALDLHPKRVPNSTMGNIFEELIRKFAEASNETAGEHFTPRDVVSLLVDVLFLNDDEVLTKEGTVRSMYDPTAGTGGILSQAQERLHSLNPDATLILFGQELNPESYATCKADLLIKGQDPENIAFGNTLTDDGHEGKTFDYQAANPPYGVDWSKIKKEIEDEHEKQGYNGRFGPGLPRVSDGSLLFVLQMLSKMKDPTGDRAKGAGSRIAVVLNGSPLFTGGAGSGESEIRRHILENDYLEAIISLPDQLFYNTGIGTYIWVLTNRKSKERKGKVQLINGSGLFAPMRKSLGNKRKEISEEQRKEICSLLGQFDESPISKIFNTTDFGYRRITVERPLLDEKGKPVLGTKGKMKGKPLPNADLRDTENVPLTESVEDYFKREVLPHVPDAYIDTEKVDEKDGEVGVVGYEINFNRYFYQFTPPRPLDQVRADVRAKEQAILKLLEEIGA